MPGHKSLLSIEDKILLHLLNYYGIKRKSEMPGELTQTGIAQAVAVNRGYIPRPLRALEDKGHILQSLGRVKGGKKKQKYYQLTKEGKGVAKELKAELSYLQITMRFPNGESKTMLIGDIKPFLDEENTCQDITGLDILINISKDRTLEIESLKTMKKTQFVDFTYEAPKVLHFFGRKKELGILGKWVGDIEGHNIIFIHGIAGIGKTTLAVKSIQAYKGSKHLFWHNFHNMDTIRGVLFKLSEFLSKLGHDHLEMYIRTRTNIDYYEVSRILSKTIGSLDAVLIFDDFHKSQDKIREFFVYFLRMLSSSSKTKIVILSREVVPFYDGRDVIAREIVAELELEGLDFESSKKLLQEKGIDKRRFKEIYGMTAGNPLFLEIFDSKGHLERYVHDELFSKLGENERKILGMISIYRFPTSEDALALNNDFDFETLYTLTQKSIVKRDSHNRYLIHDIIKQFFYTRLSSTKRRRHHILAAKWYEKRTEPIDLIEAIYHHQEAGKHEKSSQFAIDSSAIILDNGYASEFLTILERFHEKNLETGVWVEILILKGKACSMAGEWKKALLYFTQSADISTIIGDSKLKVKALCESGHILEEQNQFDRGMDSFKKCLNVSEKADYLHGMGEAYRGIGRIHWRKSQHKDAILNYERCLEFSEKVKDLELLASAYIDLGNVYDEMYKPEKAIECYKKSLDILKKTKNTYETARAYGNLAITYRHMNDFKKAIENFEKQLDIAETLNDLKVKGYCYASVSYCHAKMNDFAKAKNNAGNAKDIASKIDNENIMFQVNKTYALISREEKKWEDAVRFLEKNIVLVEKLKALYSLSDTHFDLGVIYEEMGDVDNAKKHFQIAKGLYSELGIGKSKIVKDKLSKYRQYMLKK